MNALDGLQHALESAATAVAFDADELALMAFACEERAASLDQHTTDNARRIARRNRDVAARLSDLANRQRPAVVMAGAQ
jgi:hypothetical protein